MLNIKLVEVIYVSEIHPLNTKKYKEQNEYCLAEEALLKALIKKSPRYVINIHVANLIDKEKKLHTLM